MSNKCSHCGCTNEMIFKQKDENGNVVWNCLKHRMKSQVEIHLETKSKGDYILRWRLQDEEGNEWIENHYGMSLSDFEVVYENNKYVVVWMILRQEKRATI